MTGPPAGSVSSNFHLIPFQKRSMGFKMVQGCAFKVVQGCAFKVVQGCAFKVVQSCAFKVVKRRTLQIFRSSRVTRHKSLFQIFYQESKGRRVKPSLGLFFIPLALVGTRIFDFSDFLTFQTFVTILSFLLLPSAFYLSRVETTDYHAGLLYPLASRLCMCGTDLPVGDIPPPTLPTLQVRDRLAGGGHCRAFADEVGISKR